MSKNAIAKAYEDREKAAEDFAKAATPNPATDATVAVTSPFQSPQAFGGPPDVHTSSVTPEPSVKPKKRRTLDPDVQAMADVSAILSELSEDEVSRVMAYLMDKFARDLCGEISVRDN